MPLKEFTDPGDKGSQKFTIGEIARTILETHQSSPTVTAQRVIEYLLEQAEQRGEPPVSFRDGPKPEDETVFLTVAGSPYKSSENAARAARIRTDLKDVDWKIVRVDGGWAIREISDYDNWFEYRANKDTETAVSEIRLFV